MQKIILIWCRSISIPCRNSFISSKWVWSNVHFSRWMSCLHIEWYSIDMNIRTVEILDELNNINGFHHYFGPNLGPRNKKWTGLDTVKLDWTLTQKRSQTAQTQKKSQSTVQFRARVNLIAIGIWKSKKALVHWSLLWERRERGFAAALLEFREIYRGREENGGRRRWRRRDDRE